MTDLIPIGPEELARQARELAAGSHAANTRRAYEADWRDFRGWCEQRGVSPCPADEETVVLYLTDLARSRKASTLTRRLAALAQAHRAAGWEAPGEMAGVRRLMRGIRRRLGTAPEAKRPVLIGDLKAMVKALPDTAAGLRDRALLLVGFAAALRRSELVGLDVEDLEENGDGLVVRIRRSKTDQEGKGGRWAFRGGGREVVSGAGGGGVAGTGWDRDGAAVPAGVAARADCEDAAFRRCRGADCEAACAGFGERGTAVCRAQPAGWTGDIGGDGGQARAGDHEPDGAPVRGGGAAVYQGRGAVPGECGGGAGVVRGNARGKLQ